MRINARNESRSKEKTANNPIFPEKVQPTVHYPPTR